MTITLSRRTILIAAAVGAFLLFACVAIAMIGFALFSSGSILGSSSPSLAEYQACVSEERTRNPQLTYGQQIGLCGIYTENPDIDQHYIAYVCGDPTDPKYWEYAENHASNQAHRQAVCGAFMRGDYDLVLEVQP